ncbi:MAG: ATPase, partial [Bacteroidetes bacterium]|nr:ATPase [Bacteroidota bacterium]
LIDKLGLYPITCLTTLTKMEKQRLLDKKIVLCQEIVDNENYLVQADVNPSRIKGVMEEAKKLTQNIIESGK